MTGQNPNNLAAHFNFNNLFRQNNLPTDHKTVCWTDDKRVHDKTVY